MLHVLLQGALLVQQLLLPLSFLVFRQVKKRIVDELAANYGPDIIHMQL